jgi:hypothetical protein
MLWLAALIRSSSAAGSSKTKVTVVASGVSTDRMSLPSASQFEATAGSSMSV